MCQIFANYQMQHETPIVGRREFEHDKFLQAFRRASIISSERCDLATERLAEFEADYKDKPLSIGFKDCHLIDVLGVLGRHAHPKSVTRNPKDSKHISCISRIDFP